MTVVASRTYDVDGKPLMRVSVHRPYRHESGNYLCRYELRGPKTQVSGDFGGTDEIQALLHAIYMIRLKLETCDEYVEGRLGFDGQPGFIDLPDPAQHPRHPGLPAMSLEKRPDA